MNLKEGLNFVAAGVVFAEDIESYHNEIKSIMVRPKYKNKVHGYDVGIIIVSSRLIINDSVSAIIYTPFILNSIILRNVIFKSSESKKINLINLNCVLIVWRSTSVYNTYLYGLHVNFLDDVTLGNKWIKKYQDENMLYGGKTMLWASRSFFNL